MVGRMATVPPPTNSMASQPGKLSRTAVELVEDLQRDRAVGAGDVVRPVHGGISAVAHRCVDDVTLELLARKHIHSLGSTGCTYLDPDRSVTLDTRSQQTLAFGDRRYRVLPVRVAR